MKNVDLICCGFPKRGDHRGTTGEMGLYYALTCRSIFKHQVQGDCCDREPNVNYPVSKHSRVRENHAYKWILGGFSENTLKTFYCQITPSCSCQALKSVRLWWKPVEAGEWYTDHGDEPRKCHATLQAAIRGRRVDLLQVRKGLPRFDTLC